MTSLFRTLAASLPILLASAHLSVAQPVPNEALIEPTSDLTTAALSRPVAPAPAQTPTAPISRSLWDDPKTKPSGDLAENAWDFNDPNGVPGFAPLPPAAATR